MCEQIQIPNGLTMNVLFSLMLQLNWISTGWPSIRQLGDPDVFQQVVGICGW